MRYYTYFHLFFCCRLSLHSTTPLDTFFQTTLPSKLPKPRAGIASTMQWWKTAVGLGTVQPITASWMARWRDFATRTASMVSLCSISLRVDTVLTVMQLVTGVWSFRRRWGSVENPARGGSIDQLETTNLNFWHVSRHCVYYANYEDYQEHMNDTALYTFVHVPSK